VAAVAGDPKGKSATSLLREWLRDQIALLGTANVGPLAEGGVLYLAEDQDRLNQFVTERVYDMAAEVARAMLLETRRVKRFYESENTTPEEQRVRMERWFDRMEHQPMKGYMRLGSMTRDDLITAAEEREKRAATEVATARWYRILAQGLGDEQTVREAFTPEQVAEAYSNATNDVLDRLSRLIDGGLDQALRDILGDDDEL
jgi:hypothetical protein